MRLFSLSETVTRGHNLKICKDRFNLDIGKYFFKNRVVDEWYSLPQDIVDAPSVNSFKNQLDRYFVHIEGFKSINQSIKGLLYGALLTKSQRRPNK